MGKKRRTTKPYDPGAEARIAYMTRHTPERWGPNHEALAGAQYHDVSITSATREKTARLQRFDCFVTLGITVDQHQAVRRYQDELAARYGCEGSSRMEGKVDGSSYADPISPRSMKAGETIDILASLMGETWMLPLIEALSLPGVVKGERANWKAIVRTRIGLIDRDAQARAVKIASEGVRRAWVEFDNGAMRKAA